MHTPPYTEYEQLNCYTASLAALDPSVPSLSPEEILRLEELGLLVRTPSHDHFPDHGYILTEAGMEVAQAYQDQLHTSPEPSEATNIEWKQKAEEMEARALAAENRAEDLLKTLTASCPHHKTCSIEELYGCLPCAKADIQELKIALRQLKKRFCTFLYQPGGAINTDDALLVAYIERLIENP